MDAIVGDEVVCADQVDDLVLGKSYRVMEIVAGRLRVQTVDRTRPKNSWCLTHMKDRFRAVPRTED